MGRASLRWMAVALAAPLVLATAPLGACGEDGSDYRVRAIFDSAAAAVTGSEVRVAGARVGRIESMDVTRDKHAALVLRIEDDRFTPFRADARCTIRPQSLISEKFVECEPGTAGHPRLERRDDGAELLPLARNRSSMDLDVAANVMRLPERERLSILLSELGTGLAGRESDLNAAIHRANPALRETDDLLRVLARQNRVLAGVAERSDPILGALARERRRVSGFVGGAGRTATATAERRRALRDSVSRLPAFLRELRSLMADLDGLAEQAGPGVRDLRAAAPDAGRLVRGLRPFARAAGPAVDSLGRMAATGRPALVRALPLARDLRTFARHANPVSRDLGRLTSSLDKTGAVKKIMDYLFFQTTAINGFDDLGHYLRVAMVVNLCSTYAVDPTIGCDATFGSEATSAGAARLAPLPRLSTARETTAEGSTGRAAPAGPVPSGRELAKRTREQARGPSPALRDLGRSQPLLDYFLGDG